jgi:hypothetical protein
MTPDQIGIVIADRFLSGEYTGRDNLALHISSAINQAMADERQRCAKIADHRAQIWKVTGEGICTTALREEAEDIAAAIRAQGGVIGSG